MGAVDNLTRQQELVKGLLGYRYGDETFDKWFTANVSNALAAGGLTDIRELAVDERTVKCTLGGVVTEQPAWQWVNRATGKPLGRFSMPGTSESFSFAGGGRYDAAKNACPVFDGQARYTSAHDYYQAQNAESTRRIGYNLSDIRDGLLVTEIGTYAGNDVDIYVKFADDVPYFLPIKRKHTTEGDAWRQMATFALMAASAAIPGLMAGAASLVFGATTVAAYPALTSAVMSVAMQTALNGGDVEAAARNAAASYVGASAGQFVQGVSDSEAIGRLASAATSAAARGGDIENAVTMAALQLAPSAVLSTAAGFIAPAPSVPSGETAMLDDDFDFSFGAVTDYATADWSGQDLSVPGFGADFAHQAFDIGVPMDAPTLTEFAQDFDAAAEYGFGSDFTAQTVMPSIANNAVPLTAPAAALVETAEPADSFFNDVDFTAITDKVGDVVIAALRINQAYRAMRNPPVQATAQATRNGTTQTARTDGTLATVNPSTGQTVVTRPAAGVPYRTPDGGVVINNGNGTYTAISATGAAVTRAYTAQVPPEGLAAPVAEWIPGVPNIATAAVGGLVAALLLTR